MNELRKRRGAFLRMLTGGIAVQAMISASNFAAGLLLVRRTPDAQYGYYVLISTTVLLGMVLQGAYIQPPLVIRLTRSTAAERGDLIGGLLRDQTRYMPYAALIGGIFALGLALAGLMTVPLGVILIGGTLAVMAGLRRDYFRIVLFAYRRPNDVLKSDFVFCILLVGGAYLATLTPYPAAVAAFTLAIASQAGAAFSSRALWRFEPWDRKAAGGKFRELAHQGLWSAFGGGVHWLFNQGYNYLVAGTLDVTAVAALAATRLCIMPIGLLSTGLNNLMLPTVSKWANDHVASKVIKRLALFATGLVLAAAFYVSMLWLVRDWIFLHLLKKSFSQRDSLLLAWFSIALITAFRDQIYYFLVTRARFRLIASITSLSAVVSFTISVLAMRRFGVVGALMGLFGGELFNVVGIVVYSIREARQAPHALHKPAEAEPEKGIA